MSAESHNRAARSQPPRSPWCGRAALLLACLAWTPAARAGRSAAADEVEQRAPSAEQPQATGEVHETHSAEGLAYRYRVPADYEAERGAVLTVILHGSNLDRRWGFANHSAQSFRPADIVVSPNGTSSNGSGGFNFLGESRDAQLFAALLEELRDIWNVQAVYLYGHSQGSFFALYFAGEHPRQVQGVVAHASGVWNWTKLGKKGHDQAIVLMHGTQDPVVPYRQSLGGLEALEKARYPLVRLRSLQGWNHWPAEHNLNSYGQAVPHTSQQLAWVEGMTTSDPARLAACLEVLSDTSQPEHHDWAALYTLARHASEVEGLTVKQVRAAGRIAQDVDELAERHVKQLDVPKKPSLDGEAWIGHLPIFVRTFRGVPACDALTRRHAKLLAAHEKAADKAFETYWKERDKDASEAFAAGLDALTDAYLDDRVWNTGFRKQLETWRGEADELGLKSRDCEAFDEALEALSSALRNGAAQFDELNRSYAD